MVAEGRGEQGDAVHTILITLPTGSRLPKVKDRRDEPSHGYRAVHVIVFIGELPVEIQVRTPMQDRWAQLMERLADTWGRDICYGGDPDQPDEPALGATRRDIVSTTMRLSDQIHVLEDVEGAIGCAGR